jgi:hypothetical protein
VSCRERSATSHTLIALGLAIVAIGLLWPWIGRLGLSRLPGDVFIQRDNFTFYAPTTGILLTLILSLILWLMSRCAEKPRLLSRAITRAPSPKGRWLPPLRPTSAR